MAKFLSFMSAVAVLGLLLVGMADKQELMMVRGREVMIHLGPRMFYNVDYTSKGEDEIEVVEVVDWVLWRQSYTIKNFGGHRMTRVTGIKACAGMECWDPLGYEKIPLGLRRHIEYARQQAKDIRETRAARAKAS